MNNSQEFVYNVRDIVSIRELIESSHDLYSEKTAFLYRKDDGIREVSYAEFYDEMTAFSTYLNSIGLEGKKVIVTGKNSYNWALTYFSVCAGTGIIVPVDKELSTDEINYILNTSEADAIVYSGEMEEKIKSCDTKAILLPMAEMEEYIEKGRAMQDDGNMSYKDHKIDPFALGILLFTSGTTGVAKGVMLSQYNVCSNILGVCKRIKVSTWDRCLSVLPLHHTFECMAGMLTFIWAGASIAYNQSLRTLQSDLVLFKPTVFVVVPLILETFRKTIIKKYSKITGGKAILSMQRTLSSVAGNNKKMKKKLFKTVNDAFGGNLRAVLVGAAALSPEVYNDYKSFGIDVYVGYGLTETSPVCMVHNDFYSSPDDVGYPIVGVQVKLVDINEEGIGEIAIKGPNVMLGYYNDPEETAKVIQDGWFYTGDLGKKTERGTYSITGRIKSMIVTQNGKKIFPEELEYYIEKSKFVSECMVYGYEDNGDVIVSVAIYPNAEEMESELGKRGIVPESEEYEKEQKEIFSDLVKNVNKKFAKYKTIRRIIIRKKEFEKTTTKKIKRLAKENLNEQEN